jgi:hypothetical protein
MTQHCEQQGQPPRYLVHGPEARAPVASSGMTSFPCRSHDPGGGVAGIGGIDGPLIGTGPLVGLFVTWVPASMPDR